ncbi:hypothetical protein HOC11_05465 [archaeon]|nr:hypothetical protein [archaeon]
MIIPDYKNSIVNLMSSITASMGDKPKYKPLKQLNPKEISKYKNIIFFFLDGLGYDYLEKYGKRTLMYKHLKGKITSIFPSTTAACATSYVTGVPVQQHAITGWTMFLKEIGTLTDILPFNLKIGGEAHSKLGIEPKIFFDQKSIYEKINRKSYTVYPNFILHSDFNSIYMKKAHKEGFNTINGMFRKISKVLKKPGKKFIHSYWHALDSIHHATGTNSIQSLNHIYEIDHNLQNFIKRIKGTNSLIIIASDHGHINIPEKNYINTAKHPKLMECLTLPLSGGARYAYAYVRPSKTKQFEAYVKTKLKHCCVLKKSDELIKNNYFGLYKPHKKLYDRVGDYMLIMKENYALMQKLPNLEPSFKKSLHGGTSSEEMYVPLITIGAIKF